ncbi:MAG: SE1561 family protein [Bacillus sp. (in: firmicutes)]
MGKPITNKDDQVNFLKQRLTMFLEVLDNIDPEDADLEDVDRLIEILDELEVKCEQFKAR